MPDTKFSFPKLKEHLRKYLWIYLVGIAVCLVVTNLLWTTTAPRYSIEETLVVYLAGNSSDPEPLADIAQDMLAEAQAFDETLKQAEFQSLQYVADDYTSSMLLLTRLTVGEGDAFIASQEAMDALVLSQVLVPLDEYVDAGWLSEYDLEPYYATLEDDETGEQTTFLAGLRMDKVDALYDMGAFYNKGAFLCVASNSGNVETTMKALETMMRDLTEGNYAAAKATEPAA